jgi:Undecaprenyl-phosphate glucose phosphotransferase
MNNHPRFLRSVPQEAATALADNVAGSTGATRIWRRLLRPSFVEVGVSIVDVLLIVATGLVCSWSYHWVTGLYGKVMPYAGLGLIMAANFVAIMMARQNYRLKRLILFATQARETILIWSGTYGLLAVVAFTMKISSEFSRGAVILFFAAGLAVLLTLRRFVADFLLNSLANESFAQKKIIVIAEQGQRLASGPLNELCRYGYNPVKTWEISREEIGSPGITTSLRAKLAELIQVARIEAVEDIYILVRWRHHRTIDGILDGLAVLPVSVHLVPDESAARFLNHPIANVGATWTAVLRRTPLTCAEQAVKRCFDLVLASVALLAMLPLMCVTALLVKLDSRGPIFFLQQRHGFNDQTFEIFKFRTMHVLEQGSSITQATRNDPRVTRFGRWLRKSSIDELPQLLNVLKGDMSLVGPRPHAIAHNSEYEKLIANYAFRHHVKPGLTGWAQVNGYRGETREVKQMERRVEHDLWYINNWSLWLDLKIVARTVLVALRHDKAY